MAGKSTPHPAKPSSTGNGGHSGIGGMVKPKTLKGGKGAAR